MDDMSLDGKVALVTGGARGIGRAICLALASAGASVAVNYRSSEVEAADLVRQIGAAGGKAVALAGDVCDPADTASVVARTIADLGGLHILVNNAGIVKDGLIFTMEPAGPDSAYITGACLPVDGGGTAQFGLGRPA